MAWSSRVPQEDAQAVMGKGKGVIPHFDFVLARGGGQQAITYAGQTKMKTKVFGPTDLQTIVSQWQKENPGKPLVLIPFACNYKPDEYNPSVTCGTAQPCNVQQMFL